MTEPIETTVGAGAVEQTLCPFCGTPRPLNAWCGSEECAERVEAAQARETAKRDAFLVSVDPGTGRLSSRPVVTASVPDRPGEAEEPRERVLYEFDHTKFDGTPSGTSIGWWRPNIFIAAFDGGVWSAEFVTGWRELRTVPVAAPARDGDPVDDETVEQIARRMVDDETLLVHTKPLVRSVLTAALRVLRAQIEAEREREALAFMRDPSVSPTTCKYGPHRGPQGPNEDLAQCFRCGAVSHRMRAWGDTFGAHSIDCGLPIWHGDYCSRANVPHVTSALVRLAWDGETNG